MKSRVKKITFLVLIAAFVVYFFGYLYNNSGEAYLSMNEKLSNEITARYLDQFKATPIKSMRVSSNRDILGIGWVSVYRDVPTTFILGGTLYGAPSVFYDRDERLFTFMDHRFVDLANIEIIDDQIRVHYEPDDFDHYESVLRGLSSVLETTLKKQQDYITAKESWN